MRIHLFALWRLAMCCLVPGVLLGACCLPSAFGGVDHEGDLAVDIPLPERRVDFPLEEKKPVQKLALKRKEGQSSPDMEKRQELAGLPGKDSSVLKKKKPDAGPELVLLRRVDQLSLPQSILFDSKRLRFYVSRLGDDRPKSGAVALLARDGSVIDLKWVSGLEQPRGMAIAGGRLYVADGKALVVIDIDTGKVVERFAAPKAFYLNDVVAVANGDLYVTDPLTNSIYVLRDGTSFVLWLQSSALSGPNGIMVLGDDLFVGSIGLQIGEKNPEPKGAIFKVSLGSKSVRRFANGALPPLAGVVTDGDGHIYATDDKGALLLKFSLKNGRLLERLDVGTAFNLKDTVGLGDFTYLMSSKEFWVPVKSNGHILVFGRKDAQFTSDDQP